MSEQPDPRTANPFRKWVIVTGFGILGILGLLALEVFLFDPFMHYHKPWFGYGFVSWKESYLNPGLVKHERFDAIVVGGSYVQNTKISQINKLFGVEALKVTDAGGTPANIGMLLDMGLNSPSQVNLAIVAFPVTKFEGGDVDALRHELPEYLYNDDWIDDLSYLWNADVYFEQAKNLWYALRHHHENRNAWLDRAYSWFDKYRGKSGKKHVLDHYDIPRPSSELTTDFYLDNAAKQFDAHIKPVLDAHPQVRFKFFFPPFSRLLWRDKLVQGKLRAELEIKRFLAQRLLAYPNVEVYDFMSLPQTSDLENYKDRTHYLPAVNDTVMEELSRDGHRLTAPPSDADIEAFVALVKSYDDPDIPKAAPDTEARRDRDEDENF